MRMRSRSTVLFALLLVGGMAGLVAGAARMFPGPPTDTDPRANTPNDPDFDKAEPDDPDMACAPGACSVFDEQHRLFGFAPAQSRTSAIYRDPGNPRVGQPQISGTTATATASSHPTTTRASCRRTPARTATRPSSTART